MVIGHAHPNHLIQGNAKVDDIRTALSLGNHISIGKSALTLGIEHVIVDMLVCPRISAKRPFHPLGKCALHEQGRKSRYQKCCYEQ